MSKSELHIIPDGTLVQHTDTHMRHLWGAGKVIACWGMKDKGKIVLMYKVLFQADEDTADFAEEDLTITIRGDNLEEVGVPEQQSMFSDLSTEKLT